MMLGEKGDYGSDAELPPPPLPGPGEREKKHGGIKM